MLSSLRQKTKNLSPAAPSAFMREGSTFGSTAVSVAAAPAGEISKSAAAINPHDGARVPLCTTASNPNS